MVAAEGSWPEGTFRLHLTTRTCSETRLKAPMGRDEATLAERSGVAAAAAGAPCPLLWKGTLGVVGH